MTRPRTAPTQRPTMMPTTDWIDFESTAGVSRMTRGSVADYSYLNRMAPHRDGIPAGHRVDLDVPPVDPSAHRSGAASRRSQPIVSDTSSIRPLYQSPPLPALAPIESWAVLSIRPMVVVEV